MERLLTPAKNTMARFLLPAIAGLGCVLIALYAVNAIAAIAAIRPQIGDIVAFTQPNPGESRQGAVSWT